MKQLNKFFAVLLALIAVLFMSHVFSNALGSPEYFVPFVVVLTVLGLVPRSQTKGFAFADVSPDLSALGAYAGKYSKNLHRRLMTGLQIAKDITPVFNVKHALTLTRLVINNGPKPYTGVFKSKNNDISYVPRKLEVEKFQRDISIEPSKYRTTYLGEHRAAGEGANNMSIPFAQYTNEAIIDENASVLNNETAFFGIGKAGFSAFVPATEYTGDGTEFVSYTVDDELNYFKVIAATTAGQTPVSNPEKFADANALAIAIGLGTRLKTGRTDGDIDTVTATGAITSADAYSQFLSVWRAFPEVYRNKGGVIYCSLASYDALLDNLEIDISKYTTLDIALQYLPKTGKKCELKPVSWMSGSNMLICTVKENLLYGTDLASDHNVIRVIPQMYTLDYGITGVIGFNYQDGGIISMNDQD